MCHLDTEHTSLENLIIIHIVEDISNEVKNHFSSPMKNGENMRNSLRIERIREIGDFIDTKLSNDSCFSF